MIPVVKVLVINGLQTQREPLFIASERLLKYGLSQNQRRAYLDLYLGPYPH